MTRAVTDAGLTLDVVAARLRISRNTMVAYARGTTALPEKHVPALAQLLGRSEAEVRAMGRDCRPLVARALLRDRGYRTAELPELLGLSYLRTVTGLGGLRPLPRHAVRALVELLDEPEERVMAREVIS